MKRSLAQLWPISKFAFELLEKVVDVNGSEFKIGKHNENDLQLESNDVLDFHASLIRRDCHETGNSIYEICDYS